MKKWLFNPFVYVAGTKSLIIGWATMLATACICYFSKTHFDSVVGFKSTDRAAPLYFFFIEALVNWGCLALTLFIAGRIFSKSAIRFVDVAGTQALARWPMIIVSLIGFGIRVPANIQTLPANEILKSITGTMIVLTLFGLVFVIWMVALMYNAFVVSCNIKRGKAAGVFIAGLFVAQILSMIFMHTIYHQLIP